VLVRHGLRTHACLASSSVAFLLGSIGVLGRELSGWQTICWALVLALPVTLTVSVPFALVGDLSGGTGAWLGFAYVCLFSMFLGFFAWYAGLARGGVAKIGQIQHAQPILTLAWSALALGETITTGTAVAAAVVLLFVFATQRTRVGSRPAPLVASRQ